MYDNNFRWFSFFIAFLLVSTFSIETLCQSVSVSSGYGHTTFFDFEKNQDHRYAYYSGGNHQFLKLELNAISSATTNMSIYLKLDRSTAFIESRNFGNIMVCGMGPIPTPSPMPLMNSNVSIYRMSLGVLPINLKLYNDIRFKIGFEASNIFKYSLSEIDERSPNDRINFTQNDERIVKGFSAGALFEIQLGKFDLGNNLVLIPVYNSSVSLTEEVNTGFHSRTIRQSLGIAIQWDLKPKF